MKNRAFTLIELLVVVLIIGILAAIAVPQYQKAVLKSRTSEAVIMLKSILEAQEIYYLAHDEYTNNINELDVSVPADRVYLNDNSVLPAAAANQPNSYFYTCQFKRSCLASAYNPNLPELEFQTQQGKGTDNFPSQLWGRHWCHTHPNTGKTDLATEICKSLGTKDNDMDQRYGLKTYYIIN